jgi:rhamnulokinase
MKKLLAFDYGASSGRGILGRYNGQKLSMEEIHRFSNDPLMVHGSFFWDTLRLLHEMKQGIIKCMKNGDRDISCLAIDTWGVDYGLLNKKGQLIGNPYHYRDSRTEGMIEEADRLVGKKEIYQKTGISFEKYNTLYQLMSMSRNGSKELDEAAALLFTPDLLAYFLTGEKVSEYTIASTSQMCNAFSRDWDKELLSKLGIPTHMLQNIIKPCSITGSITHLVSEELTCPQIKVAAVAGHDTASAVVSIPAIDGKYAFLSSGTWSLMGIESPKSIISDDAFLMNYTNEGGVFDTTRILKNIVGLWIYQECKRDWDKKGEVMSFDELEQQALNAKPLRLFINPDNQEFYSPGNMPNKIVEFCKRTGQSVPETKGEIVRCIMESLALKYRMTLFGLEKLVGGEIPVLHILGGGCKNVLLCKLTANAIGRPVIAGPVEATAIGNLTGQLIALGELNGINEARIMIKSSFPTVDYMPENTSEWDDAYERFEKICQM